MQRRTLNGQILEITKDVLEEADSLVEENNRPKINPIPKEILYDYEKFFAFGGGVLHPKLRDKHGFPIRILKPASYQTKFANMKKAVLLASNKIGKTMGESINDFRTRLMPETAGYDCLLVGQNQTIANEHLLDLKKWVLHSPNYSQYLITKPDKRFQLTEEKSKMRQMYVENPYDPDRASRIIAIGFSESLAYSWKNVNRLHVSDPGQISRINQTSFFSGLYSRLSNTEGDIKIEGVAGERTGYFWDLCRKLFHLEDAAEDELDISDPERAAELEIDDSKFVGSFEKMMITADDAIKENVITRNWLNYMQGILSKEEFMRIYYCVFSKPTGTIFGEFEKGQHAPLGLEDLA